MWYKNTQLTLHISFIRLQTLTVILSNTLNANKNVFLPHGCFCWITLTGLEHSDRWSKVKNFLKIDKLTFFPWVTPMSSESRFWVLLGSEERVSVIILSLSLLHQMRGNFSLFGPMMKLPGRQQPSGRQTLDNKMLVEHLEYSSAGEELYSSFRGKLFIPFTRQLGYFSD